MSNDAKHDDHPINASGRGPDPLEGLVQRTATNPGVPFEPEVLARLRELKREDRAAFENLRAELKAGEVCRVTALDEVMEEENDTDGSARPSQAKVLIRLAADAELFHAPDDTAYADLQVNGHRETWAVCQRGFKRWLTQRYFAETGGAPNTEAFNSALNAIEAMAHFEAPELDVHIRVAGHEGKLYLDLANDEWEAIEIDENGWRVVNDPPVRFRRAAGMRPIPVPTHEGSVELLRDFLNAGSDDDFVLVVSWALAVLRDRGPYPVLVLAGEQGSAKSTFAAILRALLDPNTAALRSLPREIRDLFIAANNSHVLAFDNLSGLSSWIADALCRMSTGGGLTLRQLYKDMDEVLFDVTRPVILNGIEDFVTRPDLASRAIFLTLEPIPDERRRSEKEIWADFERARPKILGGLLDALSFGLRRLPDIKLEKPPRMADFAELGVACEQSHWDAGAFMRAYDNNREEAIDTVIEGDEVGSAVCTLMGLRVAWDGTATELLSALSNEVSESVLKSRSWPKNARGLSGQLRRAAAFLRKVGIDISFGREGRARTRKIRISRTSDIGVVDPSLASAPSAGLEQTLGDEESDAVLARTEGAQAGADECEAEPAIVRESSFDINGADSADGADAEDPFAVGTDDDYPGVL